MIVTSNYILVGGFEHVVVFIQLGIIIPTDEIFFFSEREVYHQSDVDVMSAQKHSMAIS